MNININYEPYHHVFCVNKDLAAKSIDDYCADNKHYLGIVDGGLCKSENDILKLIGAAFQFPSYYGMNWNALDECINDLDWLPNYPYSGYALLFYDFDKLLRYNSTDIVSILLKYLGITIYEWVNGRDYNPSFITPPTPFHVFYHCQNERNIAHIENNLKMNGISINDVIRL